MNPIARKKGYDDCPSTGSESFENNYLGGIIMRQFAGTVVFESPTYTGKNGVQGI